MNQASSVHAFEQPWPNEPVDFDRGSDDLIRECIEVRSVHSSSGVQRSILLSVAVSSREYFFVSPWLRVEIPKTSIWQRVSVRRNGYLRRTSSSRAGA